MDVNMTTTIKRATTVACSDYLSAQSHSATKEGAWDQPIKTGQFLQSFGHSPECASFAEYSMAALDYERSASDMGNSSAVYPETMGMLTSMCPDVALHKSWTAFTPPGVYNEKIGGGPFTAWACCGECKS